VAVDKGIAIVLELIKAVGVVAILVAEPVGIVVPTQR
jgi:hypothetical protein